MQVWQIRPEHGVWRLSVQDDAEGSTYETLALAERQGRWRAVRHEIKGWPAEVQILDVDGRLIGAWRGEHYTCAAPTAFSQAA
jgi:hypothetical protein